MPRKKRRRYSDDYREVDPESRPGEIFNEMVQRYASSYEEGANRDAWIHRLMSQEEERLSAMDEGIPVSQSVLDHIDYTPAPYVEYQTPIDRAPQTEPLQDAASAYYDARVLPVVRGTLDEIPVFDHGGRAHYLPPKGALRLEGMMGEEEAAAGVHLGTGGRYYDSDLDYTAAHEMAHAIDFSTTQREPPYSVYDWHGRPRGDSPMAPPALTRGVISTEIGDAKGIRQMPGEFQQKDWWNPISADSWRAPSPPPTWKLDPSISGESWNDRLLRVAFPWIDREKQGEHWGDKREIYANVIDVRSRIRVPFRWKDIRDIQEGREINKANVPEKSYDDLKKATQHSHKKWRESVDKSGSFTKELEKRWYQEMADALNEISAVDLPAPDTPDTRGLA